jgi:hypothetical protein
LQQSFRFAQIATQPLFCFCQKEVDTNNIKKKINKFGVLEQSFLLAKVAAKPLFRFCKKGEKLCQTVKK